MDCTFKTNEGKFNYRVGAIIRNGNKILMARNPNEKREFWYSVGGRVHFGESAEEAILRELKEETGLDCKIERMAAIHENFFKLTDESAAIPSGHHTDGGPNGEFLEWIDLSDCEGKTLYPDFFKTTDFSKETGVLNFVTRD